MTATGGLAPVVAVVVARDGRLPAGAAETAAEAGGRALVVGSGAEEAAVMLFDAGSGRAGQAWWAATDTEPGALARRLAPVLEPVSLVLLPASPDGRDLAPRLAATLGRPLLAGAVQVSLVDGRVRADLLRVDGRVVVPVDGPAPAVATLMPGVRSAGLGGPAAPPAAAAIGLPGGAGSEAAGSEAAGPATELLALIKPDPATMDLADAARVLGGGAGLVARGAGDDEARALFALLARVAAALGASAGATRVVTDAGWIGAERQIGTTGVSIDPDLYVAFGVSGATQHTSGLGTPRHIVSINTDPSCPMTAMANLGLICDASRVLLRLSERLGVAGPVEASASAASATPDRPAGSGALGG